MAQSPNPTLASASIAQNRGHLYWLDWLRFVAAFMVVAIHARGNTWVEWEASPSLHKRALWQSCLR